MRVKIERISLSTIIHASEIMSCTALAVLLAFERLDAVGLRRIEQFVSVSLELHEKNLSGTVIIVIPYLAACVSHTEGKCCLVEVAASVGCEGVAE